MCWFGWSPILCVGLVEAPDYVLVWLKFQTMLVALKPQTMCWFG